MLVAEGWYAVFRSYKTFLAMLALSDFLLCVLTFIGLMATKVAAMVPEVLLPSDFAVHSKCYL